MDVDDSTCTTRMMHRYTNLPLCTRNSYSNFVSSASSNALRRHYISSAVRVSSCYITNVRTLRQLPPLSPSQFPNLHLHPPLCSTTNYSTTQSRQHAVISFFRRLHLSRAPSRSPASSRKSPRCEVRPSFFKRLADPQGIRRAAPRSDSDAHTRADRHCFKMLRLLLSRLQGR